MALPPASSGFRSLVEQIQDRSDPTRPTSASRRPARSARPMLRVDAPAAAEPTPSKAPPALLCRRWL